MYERISSHPTARNLWARTLVERGVVKPGVPEEMVQRQMRELQELLQSLKPEEALEESLPEVAPRGTARRTATAVPYDALRGFNEALLMLPDKFAPHRKLEKARERRRHAFEKPMERTIEWSAAEELALATILAGGIPVRMTGEDVERGTFSHRHAVLHDVNTGETYAPLQGFSAAKASFEIRNSPLSENGVLGFEYGYNIQAPDRLVIWEAQYGDFVNGAQVIIDEFIVSARAKWGLEPSLVLLLPHGHEGQGPDHASARPERFLNLAADLNLRLANCTTAAQYFHLLRRQALLLQKDPLPLIVLTPKSLLRHPLVASAPLELAEGRWQPVIDDARFADAASRRNVKRLVLCSGKVAIDLMTNERLASTPHVAVCRVEQLYPFPAEDVEAVLGQYPALQELTWVQEEPENMGAWDFARHSLEGLAGSRVALRVVARPRSSSPAEGSAARHARMQQQLIERALSDETVSPRPRPEEVGSRG
jgi:2-oxoglutarate dehydrogenase E1 component